MPTVTLTIEYEQTQLAELSAAHAQLCATARAATATAYAPYSNFRVGAAALLADGSHVAAANLENSAYPQCLCAEACLLGAVHALPGRHAIAAVAVAVDAPSLRGAVTAPCGSCRQQLFEAEWRQGGPIAVLLVGEGGEVLRFARVSDLLPLGMTL